MAVDFESTGVVILLEVRPLGGALQSVPDDLAPVQDAARRMLASPGAGARWLPASEDGLAGQMDVEDVAAALPLLHALRTSLRQDPAAVPLGITAGLGIGGGVEASGLAGAAFRSLDQSKRPGTRGLTPDPRINAGLDALFRTMDFLETGWTAAQWQAIHHRRSGGTLMEIGTDLGIAYQNVSKRLLAANYRLYCEVLEGCSRLLS